MPYKFHASRRHHIPIAQHRVTNWPDHDRGLVRRGDIRFWIDEGVPVRQNGTEPIQTTPRRVHTPKPQMPPKKTESAHLPF